MRTYTAPIQQQGQTKTTGTKTTAGTNIVPAMTVSIREMLALLSALTAATGIVLLSVWVAGMEFNDLLGAGTWGLGFIFLGLAVDNREPLALLQLLSGVVMLILAWLQFAVSADFTIATGVLLALWVAVGMYRQLR